jgi:cell division septal protein FtsQ
MSSKSKWTSIGILILAIAGMTYLSISLEGKSKTKKINFLELKGNYHLTEDQYLKFANLYDREKYNGLNSILIRDRLIKHPYVKNVDVKYDEDNKATITLTEKEFETVLLINGKNYFLTNNFELLPFLPYTQKIDYPVIVNPNNSGEYKKFEKLNNSDDIITAYKILDAVKLTDSELLAGLSEIDMQYGNEIVLYFTFLNYPVIIGRGEEIKKVAIFQKLWDSIKGNYVNKELKYLDLRYSEKVYLGLSKALRKSGENS